jgi:hypothetical protein
MQATAAPLCTTCHHHFGTPIGSHYCAHPDEVFSPVHGQPMTNCGIARHKAYPCGPKALRYTPKKAESNSTSQEEARSETAHTQILDGLRLDVTVDNLEQAACIHLSIAAAWNTRVEVFHPLDADECEELGQALLKAAAHLRAAFEGGAA